MAKKPIQNLDLDSLADDADLTVPVVVPQVQAQAAAELQKLTSVIIEVPLLNVHETAYRPRHLNVQLNAMEADAMKRLLAGLDVRGDRVGGPDGRRVQTAADAVRWLLEQVGK
jgi:hypothetical protein